jgi:mevalonate kinase
MVVASAPGKVILFGEHAVVYDKLGIACTIDKRCYVRISSFNQKKVIIESKDLNLKKNLTERQLFELFEMITSFKKDNRFDQIKEIFKRDELSPGFFVVSHLFREYPFVGLRIEIESNIPKNLGSSSAVFSSIALALSKFLGKEASKKEISNLAFQGDIMAHGGTPSGIDNTIVTYGGYLKYRKSEGVELLKIDSGIPLLIVDSGEDSRTGEAVAYVRKQREENFNFVNKTLDSLNIISEKALASLRSKDFVNFGQLMVEYYEKLKELDISTPNLDKIIDIALKNGSLGAKPTGAWKGGCCLVLTKNEENMLNLKRAFKEKGFQSFQCQTGVRGVEIIHEKSNRHS